MDARGGLQHSRKKAKKAKAAQQQESQNLLNTNRSDPNEMQHEHQLKSSLEQGVVIQDIRQIFSSLRVITINSLNKNDTLPEKKYDDESIGQDHTITHISDGQDRLDDNFKVRVEDLEKISRMIDRCAEQYAEMIEAIAKAQEEIDRGIEANGKALEKLTKDAEENGKALERVTKKSEANGRALEANGRALEKLSKSIERCEINVQKNINSLKANDTRVTTVIEEVKAIHLHEEGVLFDMDGTLTVPVLDFAGMRSALGIPRPLDMLEEIEKMDAEAKQRALKIIEEFEEEGKRRFELQPGVHELMEFLDHHKIPKAIITRNSQEAIEFMKTKVNFGFSLEISRDFKPFKPSPDPALHVCKTWNVDPQHCVFVGDSKDDMLCGRQAGNITVLLKQDNNKDPNIHTWTDFTVSHLIEVKKLIAEGFELEKR